MTNEEIKICLTFLENESKKIKDMPIKNFKDAIQIMQIDLKFMKKKNDYLKEVGRYGNA